jgi:hypothetical protein
MLSIWRGVVITTQVVFDMEGRSNLNNPDSPVIRTIPPFPINSGRPPQRSVYGGGADQCCRAGPGASFVIILSDTPQR